MRRVLLHLGLHKTGTTAAQSFLFENRELIWPRHALVLPYRTRKTGLSEAATRHSVYGLPSTLSEFRDKMRDFLASLDFGEKRGLILSEENFSGLRPSRNVAVGYEAAPELAACLVELVQERLGDEVDITLYLSLRQRGGWLRSLWSHDLLRTRLVQDFETYRDRMAEVPSPQTAAMQIRDRIENARVKTEWLEDLQYRPFGAGDPFAAFLDLPPELKSKLLAPTRVNPRLPEDLLEELLQLNRSGLDDAALELQKTALVENAQKDLARTR
ncbi:MULTISPECIES: hypothetical protein [unclassified Ruegeria]|uniref:hypothetical protein n=1 Tax=unclassified Ruegeria TaxID=2625375 RepID=UPI001487BE60|nr:MULTISPECIES: hypothetical protein [unclassified Ruegeria]